MKITFNNVSLIFAAGCFGGLAKGFLAWLFGAVGLNALLGSQFAPQLGPQWLYSHMVWGGIWAMLFLLPIRGWSLYSLGIFYSLPQSIISLLVMFPQMGRGLMGLQLGYSTPVLAIFFGFVWGLGTAFWWKISRKSA
jgi:hypothetical protein